MARDNTHALSFGLAVDDYERGRPSYPAAAVDWMLAQSSPNEPPSAADLVIVDVGAGTGKFTASFAERGLNVTAVEPDSAMRARFSARFPHVEALEGTGESLPLPDTSVDLVTFAQAWHWVDVEAASAEIARVLKPGGTLGLIWNIRDDSVEWVRQLGEIMGASAAEEYETLTPPVGASLERVAHADFFWDNPLSREQLLAMVTSRSYIIAMGEDERRALLQQLEELLDEHPQLPGHDTYVMPYVTSVTLARALPVS